MKPSELIDKRIAELTDWRGEVFARLRQIINEADPNLQEDWKWDTAVWIWNGNVCALGAMKEHVKINFFKGALVPDPHKLFNAGLESKNSRAIDFHEGDKIDESELKNLIQAAVALNTKKK